jgi:hypothetical protein
MATLKRIIFKIYDYYKGNKSTIMLVIILISLAVPLRFKDLGYSDYHGDEYKAFLKLDDTDTAWNFLLRQRKGPMQFIVSYIPYIFTGDFLNETAQRLPFSIASTFSIIFFFLFVKNITKSKLMAFLASLLFITNGFISGFGRIAQYQNLNLLFSFTALYLYSKIIDRPLYEKKIQILTFFGTFFWCLSVLSHWDGVLIAPIVIYIVVRSLLKSKDNKKRALVVVLSNIVLGLAITLPFIVPYIDQFRETEANQNYAVRRVGLDIGYSKLPLYKALTQLYNPFLTLPLLLISAAVGLLNIKKSFPIFLWFILVFGFFEMYVKNPGTHFYNFLLPLIILAGIGMGSIINLHVTTKILYTPVILVVLIFLYFQTYILYVDHSAEYPFVNKKVLVLINPFKPDKNLFNLVAVGIKEIKPSYMRGSYIPLFGFTHHRFWNEVNDLVNELNQTNNENFKYITNEDKSISEKYMDTKYGVSGGFYAIGIKRPMNFVADFSFSNYGSKRPIYTFTQNGEVVTFIYRFAPKDNLSSTK